LEDGMKEEECARVPKVESLELEYWKVGWNVGMLENGRMEWWMMKYEY
jgi:hypothetical protein